MQTDPSLRIEDETLGEGVSDLLYELLPYAVLQKLLRVDFNYADQSCLHHEDSLSKD